MANYMHIYFLILYKVLNYTIIVMGGSQYSFIYTFYIYGKLFNFRYCVFMYIKASIYVKRITKIQNSKTKERTNRWKPHTKEEQKQNRIYKWNVNEITTYIYTYLFSKQFKCYRADKEWNVKMWKKRKYFYFLFLQAKKKYKYIKVDIK